MSKPSIIQPSTEQCYYCGAWFSDYHRGSTHELIPGSMRRKKCIEDGLTVKVCLNPCHHIVQHTASIQREYEQIAQVAWMERNNKGIPDFVRRYGENFLDVEFERSSNLMKYRMEAN